jgi:hypothetical protein
MIAIVIQFRLLRQLTYDLARFVFENGFHFLGFALPSGHATYIRGVNSDSRGHANI